MNKRRIAIYSRKSKFTGKGDSIENQVTLCRKYIESTLNNKDFSYLPNDILLFEDEGFSGGNIDRPQFKKMMEEVVKRNIEIILVYRLDRISRNIADFSNLLEVLRKYDVQFISITENFGGISPISNAMMNMTSVFSQLEREVTAERIRDNMLELSKSGRWLGGNVPLGYQSQELSYADPTGKIRKTYSLSSIDDELAVVKLIYNKFLELGSLTKLETYLINHTIKTKNNVYYSRFALRNILTNPVYAIADTLLLDYFKSLGCSISTPYPDFTHQYGIMAYNRTKQVKGCCTKQRDYCEWIIALGKHQGIIYSNNWIKVQNIIYANKDKTFRKTKSTVALLSGLIICKNCGSYMRPKNGRINKEGKQSFYYVCELKEKSHGEKCNMANLNGLTVDALVIEQIKQLHSNPSHLLTKLAKSKEKLKDLENQSETEKKYLQIKIKKNQKAIACSIKKLSLIEDDDITLAIVNNIKELKRENQLLESKLLEFDPPIHLTTSSLSTLKYRSLRLASFGDELASLELTKQRSYISTLVEKIEWDGQNVEVYLLGPKSQKRMSQMFPDSVDRE